MVTNVGDKFPSQGRKLRGENGSQSCGALCSLAVGSYIDTSPFICKLLSISAYTFCCLHDVAWWRPLKMFHIFKDHLYTVYSESESCSVLSDSLRPNGLYSPWNSPCQNTGMGSFSLLQGIFPTQGSNPGFPHCRQILYQLSHNRSPVYSISEVKWSEVAQSCLSLCDPMDCSLTGSSINGILQARILDWVASSFSRGSSRPRDWTRVSGTAGRCFTLWATREAYTV